MSTKSVSDNSSDVLRKTTLAPAIQSEDGKTLSDVVQFVGPLTATAGITVKDDYGRGLRPG